MKTVSRTKLFVLSLATVLLGFASVATAQDDGADEEAAVEEADEETTEAAETGEETAQQEDTGESDGEADGEESDEDESDGEEADGEEETGDGAADAEQEAADDEESSEGDDMAGEEEMTDEDPWADAEEEAEEAGEETAEEGEETDEDGEETVEEGEETDEEDGGDGEDEEPFSPTFGFGLDTGFFFTDLARFNDYILAPNDRNEFGTLGAQHVDLAVESEVVENLRISILGGATFAWQTDPGLFGWYVGLEPAYVVGDDQWGMAIGVTGGIGGLRLTTGEDRAAMSLTVLRPFIEGRRYFSENVAAHLRVGFNQWYPSNPRSEELDLDTAPADRRLGTVDLATGGLFASVGVRFGALQGLSDPAEMETTEDQNGDESTEDAGDGE